MTDASLPQFRASLQVSLLQGKCPEELAFVYWNRESLSKDSLLPDDALHIIRRSNGSFYLEIGNILHEGDLPMLEEILFEWARDEGWLATNE
jgi:hypothetical protein